MGWVNGIYRPHHTGIVKEVFARKFGSIEGNTNLNGSANGTGVFELERGPDRPLSLRGLQRYRA